MEPTTKPLIASLAAEILLQQEPAFLQRDPLGSTKGTALYPPAGGDREWGRTAILKRLRRAVGIGEWLAYAEQEVPRLFQEGDAKGSVHSQGEPDGVRDGFLGARRTPPRYQQPVLFDFRKGKRESFLRISPAVSRPWGAEAAASLPTTRALRVSASSELRQSTLGRLGLRDHCGSSLSR